MSDKLLLPASIIIAGILIGGGMFINAKISKDNSSLNREQNTNSRNIKESIRPIDSNDHILGKTEARIIIVNYSDTECAYCKVFHKTMLSLMSQYGTSGDIAWVYRHYPIDELHSKSRKEAEALECAANVGGNYKFWEYTNRLYEITPSNNGLEYAKLSDIAKDVGLPVDQFNQCLESGEFYSKVEADIKNAQEIGASGTPYNVIIDTKNNEYTEINGALPYFNLKQIIDIILSN